MGCSKEGRGLNGKAIREGEVKRRRDTEKMHVGI